MTTNRSKRARTIARNTIAPRRLRHLAATTAVAALLPLSAMAQSIDACTLVNGVLPAGCEQPNANTVVHMPAGANTETTAPAADLGPYGFAITIETAAPVARKPDGTMAEPTDARRVDRILEDAGVQVTYDGLGAKPLLAVSTADMRTGYVAGAPITFRASSNYPAWISRAEVRVVDARHPTKTVAVLPVKANGTVDWAMPADGAEEMIYALRVYDSAGHFDETRVLRLNRTAKDFPAEAKDGKIVAAGEGEDMTARRAIPVRGGAVTVTGNTLYGGSTVSVMGEQAIADESGTFVLQRILPPGSHDIRVGVGQGGVTRHVEVPQTEWFYVGLADVTYGREFGGDSYSLGRLAGYAKGHTAGGYTITGSIDTREGELADLFSGLDEKNPDRTLRRIEPDDVYPTFGDDSTAFEDAPTSGKLFLKVEKDRSAFTWGDFKASNGATRLIRSDRTLYGAHVEHASLAQTPDGEARFKFSAFAAEPDRLVQRDILRGTGGSAYFLKRQDILSGTETLLVQWRDPVSGHVVRSQTLTIGDDYEIDYFQGVVILKRPLGSSAGSAVVTSRPLGEYDVNLVAQYEYVPTTGNVDGYSAGARFETWVTDAVRVGVSGQSETTGIADNSILGADILLRKSDNTYLSFDYARSEGPGFGTDLSLNGGLDIDTGATAGVSGLPADGYRVEGKADLAELTGGAMTGEVAAYFDRKEEGFTSADYDIDSTQTDWGLSGKVGLSSRTDLTFGYQDFKDADGKHQTDGKLGLAYAINDQWGVEVGVAQTDRADPDANADQIGSRTDAGARLTWTRDEDLKAWVFGQTTVSRSGGLSDNDRLGFGAEVRLSERVTAEAEISGGSLGTAGFAGLAYDNQAGSQYHIGYKLDPIRVENADDFSGTDGGTWVLGATSKISDSVTYRAENTYDLFGDNRSITQAYGVRYTPSDVWSYDGALEFGESDDSAGVTTKRRAISLGVAFSDTDRLKAGLKGEARRETSSDGDADRTTWLVSGYARSQTSEDWRLLANIDALISTSDQSSIRDGRYVEANIGYAYRPVAHDRLNALLRYTYLYDMPGEDQVNIDGELEGPRQRSHILSFDVNYDLSKQWTLGAKYGYRLGEVADRGSNSFSKNTADLGILRLDYHVVHNWDMLLEGRVANYHEADATEYGALAGIYRHFGNNVKFGVGYQWGDVSDDLRSLDGRKEGVFLNLVGKF